MAEQMKDIKRRIKSVSSIRQITNAMELVSTAKMRKSRIKLESTRPFYTTVVNSIGELLSLTQGAITPLTKVREVKNRLYVVLASDRGLAGGYNSNILRYAQAQIEDKEDRLIVVGVKALDYFSKRGYNVIKSLTGISENFDFHDAKDITDSILSLYKEEKIDAVHLIFTNFKSALNQDPTRLQLLPSEGFKVESRRRTQVISYEPSPEVMLDYLVEQYVSIAIYGALIESSASEQAARRSAMESATDNADEMIDELSLKYNRARQANITQELTEIVSGAEALK
ncbi:MAG: ATP synthase F1 subunit gamma [Tissierellia bacterium]|nr:ATP synthase F1 subunit gamma [Tissierellia bacterium]